MNKKLHVLMAQINPVVGAIGENTQKIISIIKDNQANCDLIIFPELILTGYPPEDILLHPEVYAHMEESIKKIQAQVQDCTVIVGHPSYETQKFFNSATIISSSSLQRYHKQILPNYGIFDERRYFTEGNENCIFSLQGFKIGLCICEDVWLPAPVEALQQQEIELLVCINASPFESGKQEKRENLLRQYAQQGLAVIYVNQVGGQDEIVFDGLSFAMNQQGETAARAPAFQESLLEVTIKSQKIAGTIWHLPKKEALLYDALLCGVRDYIKKNNFPGVFIGLSGGIDSALTLAIAVDALGAENVEGVLMPSQYTSEMSNNDAKAQANAMGVKYHTISIQEIFEAYNKSLEPVFSGRSPNITEENLQARIRGSLLMALSNKFEKMVLCTSNKSETAVGYTTLYGDMIGGLAPLKDVYKSEVYELANYRNTIEHVIPERVITRAPTAELAPNQKDEDTLPPYALLDAILRLFIEEKYSLPQLLALGFPPDTISQVISMVIRNEYKRRQGPPGIKVSRCNFDRDWRYPITSHFKQEILQNNRKTLT
jgi:NAD+ synthase (glutamine-hydrolysing)